MFRNPRRGEETNVARSVFTVGGEAPDALRMVISNTFEYGTSGMIADPNGETLSSIE